jgi:CubicO group peptidase (beta-lactamase class C family)
MSLPAVANDLSWAWMTRFLMLALALIALCAPAAAEETKVCGAPAALADGWTITVQADLGLDPAKLCELDSFIAQWPQANIHAVVVVRKGKLAMERYFSGADERWGSSLGTVQYAADVKHDLRSISKSVTSLLVGIARGEGKFPALESSAIDFFPRYASLKTADNGRITFADFLTMSSGLAWDESLPYSNPANSERRLIDAADPLKYVFEQRLVARPGETYNYNGGGTTVLAAAVAKATGQRLDDYARDKLFSPLDITDFEWVKLPFAADAPPAAASGLRLRARDTAKLGQILLSDGVWKEKQVLPKGWAADSIKPRINGDGLYFYGYQWWLGRSFRNGAEVTWAAGVGYGGQRLYVVPALDLVVMVNAGHYGGPLQGVIPLGIFTRVVLPAVKD